MKNTHTISSRANDPTQQQPMKEIKDANFEFGKTRRRKVQGGREEENEETLDFRKSIVN